MRNIRLVLLCAVVLASVSGCSTYCQSPYCTASKANNHRVVRYAKAPINHRVVRYKK